MDGDDKWFYPVHDERWRMVANFREDDSDPKEEWVPHQAGLDGFGGSSYINLVICRDKDADTAWTSASDGTLEERIYYCQNWRGDVSALVYSNGDIVEWVKYSSYGVPFGLPGGDTDSDGDCDSSDVTQIQAWIDAPAYEVRGDIDLDGDIDTSDKSSAVSNYQGLDLARGVTSSQGNIHGWMGAAATGLLYHVRRRVLHSELGRWIRRDPAVYIDGVALYQGLQSNPIHRSDPSGLASCAVADGRQCASCEPYATTSSFPSGGPCGFR